MRGRLDRLAAGAKLVIAFERLWPPAVAVGTLVALFVAVSWLGLWEGLPAWGRIIGVLVFGAGCLATMALGVRRGWPTRRDALLRLDRDSGLRHRPVSSSEDVLSHSDPDPATRALWELHRRRQAQAAAQVRLARPSPRTVERDRYALRAAAVLALVGAGFVAGPDKEGRLAAAFDWRGASAPGAGFRLDSWIDPPAYTGRPPVLLASSAGTAAVETPVGVVVPVNSVAVVRFAGDGRVDIAAEGAVVPPAAPKPATGGSAAPASAALGGGTEKRFSVAGDGKLTVSRDGTRIAAFDIKAVPDLPPTISVTQPPVRNLRGSLTLAYKIDDDYGVVGADASFARPVLHGKPVTGRSLVEAPKVPLTLPANPRGIGTAQTTADLAEHPWAGAEVTMVLSAHDEGGNVGRSAPVTTTLPARAFTQPLARALVEQRRALVLDPDHREAIGTALEALDLAPDLFDIPLPIHLGLYSAKQRLDHARADADLLEVADLLWSMALQIEDGDLSQTERDLRALQQQLQDALAKGASPDEIKRLTQALREQLDKFLSEMAQKNAASPDAQARGDARTVTPRDLQSMLDRLERSARNGDIADAQRALDELRDILENLRSAQRGDTDGEQASREMSRSMSALQKMMRDQGSLRDRTFQQGRQGRKSARQRDSESDGAQDSPEADQQAQDGDQDGADGGDEGSKALQGQQGSLRQQLQQLQKRLRELGLNGEQGFDEAEQAMKDAEAALGKGAAGSDQAVEAQGRALQGLQKGQQGMAGQMAQGQGEGSGEDGIGREDGAGQRKGSQTDPLGRPREARGSAGHDLELEGGLAARAQRVLEELRRRLGDPTRPRDEQDYLERLLRRY